MLTRITFLFVIVALAGCTHFSHSNAPFAGKTAGTGSPIAYQCESGQTIDATYYSYSAAVVRCEGRTREMVVAISGSGARYVGGGWNGGRRAWGQGRRGRSSVMKMTVLQEK